MQFARQEPVSRIGQGHYNGIEPRGRSLSQALSITLWGKSVDHEVGLWFCVAQCYWLALPMILSGIVHMFIVKHDWLPRWNVPIDAGRTFDGFRIMGDNKTWRGVIVMTTFGGLFGALVGLFGGNWAQISGINPLPYDRIGFGNSAWGLALGYGLVNLVFGLAYVAGELPNSLIKRRLGVPPGKTPWGGRGLLFLLIDQADSTLAVLLTAVLIFGLSWRTFVVGMLSLTLLHFVVNVVLYVTRVRKNL